MDRRKFITELSSGAAAIGLGAKAASAANPTSENVRLPRNQKAGTASAHGPHRRPNVILIMCDDLGFADLGCYGSKLPTPNLDAMAADGTRFTRWNSAHPICSASRAAILTGRYGVRMHTANAFIPTSKGTSLDETLMSSLFQDKGYSTKAVGKWHLGFPSPYLPTNRGFDSYLGVPWSVDMSPLPLVRDEKVIQENADRDTLTPLYTQEAVRFLEEPKRKEEPFFLFLAYSYPHDPARASARFRDKSGFGHVGDSIAEIDWSVGEVIEAVEKQGLTDDTLILFTSDHGPWYQGSPGALRGRKTSSWEGGSRVPMIAKWPGKIAAGRTVDTWCTHLEVLPTFAKLCGLSLPKKPLDGVEITGVFLGNQKKVERKPVIYFHPPGDHGLDVHCIRDEHWKLRVAQAYGGEIYLHDHNINQKGSRWLARFELYNLEMDPMESYDIAHLHPQIVARLLQNLEEQMKGFPPRVKKAYAALKENKGDISTPPGASPAPYNPNRKRGWEPPDRRYGASDHA